MHRVFTRAVVIGAAILAVGATAGAAWAWSSFSDLTVKSAGVSFVGVELSSPNKGANRCTIRVRVKARIPDASPRNFRITVKTAKGKSVVHSVALRGKKGTRWVEFWSNTRSADCWASTPQKPLSLDVKGCKGDRCRPE